MGEGDAAEEALSKGKEVTHMPGFNGTGPMGAGPMTGGGRGYCGANATPRFQSSSGRTGYGGRGGRGRGFGGGSGRGFGYGRQFSAQQPAASSMTQAGDELNMLRAQADQMAAALEEIQNRMAELEKRSET